MLKGCSSNIPCGWTNKNENLHKSVNPFFSRCRMGIPLALALLTILFHQHNQEISNSSLPTLHARILPFSASSEVPQFGILANNKTLPDKARWIFGSSIKAIPEAESLSLDGGVIELQLPLSLEDHVSINDIFLVLFKAITTLQIIEQVSKPMHSSIKNIMVKMAPFMSCNITSIFSIDQDPDKDQHQQRLQSIVQSCGYRICSIAPDGNCCFAAVAFGLLMQQNEITIKLPSFFEEKSLPMQNGLEELARVLTGKNCR